MDSDHWQSLIAQLEALPSAVVWDIAEPVQAFKARLGQFDRTDQVTEQVIEAVVDYVLDPLLHHEHFLEWITFIYRDYGVDETPLRLTPYIQAVEALGLEIIGQMTYLGLFERGEQSLYRFNGMLGGAAVLRKVTEEELLDVDRRLG